MIGYLELASAIIFECIGINALKASNGFSNIFYDILMIVTYLISFISLSLCLKHIGLGITYAIWSAIGTILISISGVIIWKETLNMKAVIGIIIIIIGVIILNLNTSSK